MKKLIWGIVFFVYLLAAGFTAQGESVRYVPGSVDQIRAVSTALHYVGTPYKLGGNDAGGLDCSGLVQLAFRDFVDFSLPRRTDQLFRLGSAPDGALLPGDLVFFDTTGGPSHVGIYSGDSYFIHSASSGPKIGVVLSSLHEEYYKKRYLGARRILPWSMPFFEIRLSEAPESHVNRRKVAPGLLLGFRLLPLRDKATSWYVTLVWNDEPHMKRRVVLIPEKESFFWIFTRPGKWTVSLNLEKGEGFLSFDFFVEETE